ncbi:uncharacterized protein EV422DRAFT_260242 [Fimicolochytrium jonesii]|uniref:uncharacterized protein n=1 Tax=Fimicolochytrium jonesii TaxID=1396493 RepID=UPI0022FE1035|nr:uncharacterized protein EV422DRAFT_260242 [Fimicolochytrium jonesii]KAI8817213.1 hypothetical protein EV422DRAFT_260242 [Fimicolochytrium jonesii]
MLSSMFYDHSCGIGSFRCALEGPAWTCVGGSDGCPRKLRFHKSKLPCATLSPPRVGVGRGVELLIAGFPCQDLSHTGSKTGLAGMESSIIGRLFNMLRRIGASCCVCPWDWPMHFPSAFC